MIGQKKSHSLIEAIINIVVGIILGFFLNSFIFPLLGIVITKIQNIELVAVFTIVSLLRSYILRRIFNRIMLCPKKKI